QITTSLPLGNINRWSNKKGKCPFDCLSDVLGVYSNWPNKAIIMKRTLHLNSLRWCMGSNQNWSDADCMAGIVKIFQIKGIVPDLVKGSTGKIFFTDFELKHKEYMPNQQDNIDSSTKTRNGVFKIDLGDALDIRRKIKVSKNFDLLLPGIVLIQLNASTCMPSQFAEDLFWAHGSEMIERVPIEPAAQDR